MGNNIENIASKGSKAINRMSEELLIKKELQAYEIFDVFLKYGCKDDVEPQKDIVVPRAEGAKIFNY